MKSFATLKPQLIQFKAKNNHAFVMCKCE